MHRVHHVSRRHFPSMVGRNADGHWIVCNPSGLRGRVFVDRTEALRFALLKAGRGPRATIMVPGIIEAAIR